VSGEISSPQRSASVEFTELVVANAVNSLIVFTRTSRVIDVG
jgi:hypothetical protein